MKTLFWGGDIITMEQTEAQAVLVEDGVIQAVGEKEALCAIAGKDAVQIFLDGATLMPSFIDAHSHITAVAASLRMVDLSGVKSIPQLLQQLRQQGSAQEWLLAYGYDHNALKEKRHPTKGELDSVSRNRPILVTHRSGHMGVLNSAALHAAGIGEDAECPDGGVIGRTDTGELTGYLEEAAFMKATQKVPSPSEEVSCQLMEKAQKLYSSYGITTVQEGRVAEQEFNVLSAACQKGKLFLDIIGYLDYFRTDQQGQSKFFCEENRNGHFKIGGYKIFLDGSPQGRTAWMSTPYTGDERNYYGYPTHTDQEVLEAVSNCVQSRKQLLAHCNGDAAAAQLISAFEKVGGGKATRPVLIHAQLLRPDQLDAVKQFGLIPSYFIAHIKYWGDVHIKNFGFSRAAQISPAASTVKAGIPFTFHQDSPVIQPNMLETVQCAAVRKTASGTVLGEEEKISVYEALKAVTLYGAYQYFEEDEKGSVKEGKRADFVILDRNPLKVRTDEIEKIRVLQTWKDGACIYRV